jgi:hypothetical protein
MNVTGGPIPIDQLMLHRRRDEEPDRQRNQQQGRNGEDMIMAGQPVENWAEDPLELKPQHDLRCQNQDMGFVESDFDFPGQ